MKTESELRDECLKEISKLSEAELESVAKFLGLCCNSGDVSLQIIKYLYSSEVRNLAEACNFYEELYSFIHGVVMRQEDLISFEMPPWEPESKLFTMHENAQGTSSSFKLVPFKIKGSIGIPGQKDKLSYTSLLFQVESGKASGYPKEEIISGIIQAITPGLPLRDYLETRGNLSLESLL